MGSWTRAAKCLSQVLRRDLRRHGDGVVRVDNTASRRRRARRLVLRCPSPGRYGVPQGSSGWAAPRRSWNRASVTTTRVGP